MGRCTPLWFHPVNLRFVMCNDMIWRNTCNNTSKCMGLFFKYWENSSDIFEE